MRTRPLRAASNPVEPLPVSAPPSEMRAIVFDRAGAPDVLVPATAPVPTPLLSEVLVRVVAAGINPIDAKTRSGAGAYAALESFPSTLGFDFSGVVVKSPYEAHPFPPGTPVFVDAAEAHAELEQGHTRGKIVLRVSDG